VVTVVVVVDDINLKTIAWRHTLHVATHHTDLNMVALGFHYVYRHYFLLAEVDKVAKSVVNLAEHLLSTIHDLWSLHPCGSFESAMNAVCLSLILSHTQIAHNELVHQTTTIGFRWYLFVCRFASSTSSSPLTHWSMAFYIVKGFRRS
jgi:hypothetical protein